MKKFIPIRIVALLLLISILLPPHSSYLPMSVDALSPSKTTTIQDTNALVDIMLSRDYTNIFIYANTPNQIYPTLRAKTPELALLEYRADAATILLNRYTELLNNQNKTTDTEHRSHISVLTLLLAQDVFYDQLTSTEQQSFINTMNQAQSASVLATSSYSTDSWQGVDNIWYNYSHSISTLQGELVPLFKAATNLTAERIAEIDAQTDSAFPNCTRLSSADPYYNCHSYAWYRQMFSNGYWINDIEAYADDPHHIVRSEIDEAAVGDIVVYYFIVNNTMYFTHSAVITEIEDRLILGRKVTCTSKWGAAGVYEHDIDNVPDSYYVGSDPQYLILYRMRSHTYASLYSTTPTKHTYKCLHCSDTKTSSHTFNNFNICTECGYKTSGSSTIDNINDNNHN